MSALTKKWLIEGVSWLLTVILTTVVLLPVYQAGIVFDWWHYNILYLIGAFTLLRYLFFFRYHPLEKSRVFKVLAIFAVPLLFFPILEGLHSFLEYSDRVGLQSFMSHLTIQKQNWFEQYIRTEYILSGVTCMIGAFALIIKMIRSLWRQYRFG